MGLDAGAFSSSNPAVACHFHSAIVKQIKQVSAFAILQALRARPAASSGGGLFARLRLPAAVHDRAQCCVWAAPFLSLNVYSEKKRLEKLDYMHNNPGRRGLAASPGLGPWSSWRFYYLNDQSALSMDRLP